MFLHRAQGALFTREECATIISEAEGASDAVQGWTTSRHYSVPTTDIPVHHLPKTLAWFNEALRSKLAPMLAAQYPTGVQNANRVWNQNTIQKKPDRSKIDRSHTVCRQNVSCI